MQSFMSLYNKIAKAAVYNRLNSGIDEIRKSPDYDAHQLDCLLNPENRPAVIRLSACGCSDADKRRCADRCLFNAISKDENGDMEISGDKCVGCSECIDNCASDNLTDRKDIVPVFRLLESKKNIVYAMVAPAYISQFGKEVTPGKLRSAFKRLGFAGMIEVALFADILTLKEALEFDNYVQTESDFMLTSCCCPIWIAMIRKIYYELIPHMPPSVSPMAACGRSVKKLYPEAITVFIGPCIAKKAEARGKDIIDAVDHVLTFQEMQEIFTLAGIDPSKQEEDIREHSSKAGRIYARTAGVSEAVKDTLEMLRSRGTVPFLSMQADGAAACKAMLKDLREGKSGANFIEGMGCVGGCVGGPKALIKKENASDHINDYANNAPFKTPIENTYVIELLSRLGFDSIESLIKGDNIFTRDFRSVR